MTEFIPCPLPDCDKPATAEDRGYANGSPMPVRLVKVVCAAGHAFMGAADGFGAEA